jgi:type II secretion system protein H
MRGFTLLEMLVALAIASIMLAIVSLQLMPTEEGVLREESERLAFLLENGAMSSRAGGLPLAWSGTGNSYRFWQRNKAREWVRIEHDNLLHPRDLSDAVKVVEVSFDGRRLEPGALVILSPELSAKRFVISLRNGKSKNEVVGDGIGKVHVVRGAE